MKKARPFQKQRLALQPLEARLAPSTVTTVDSTNWSGYAVTSSNGAVTSVSGSWVVPAVTGKGTTYASSWVGIDGYSSSSVEQIGTAEQVANGKATYYAWYEMYPAGMVTISSITVKAGDTVSASVSYSGGTFTMSLTDGSQKTYTVAKSGSSAARSSAEWIQEAPSSSSGVLPLANFSKVGFSSANATINSTNGSISAGFGGSTQIYEINMETRTGVLKANTSSLNSSGTGFTVTWDSSGAGGGGSGKAGPDAQFADPVAYTLSPSNPFVSTSTFNPSLSGGVFVAPPVSSVSSWSLGAHQTFYASPQRNDVSSIEIQVPKSIESGTLPANEDIWLGKPLQGDMPQTPVKTDEILGNGTMANEYLVEDGEVLRQFEENKPALVSESNRRDLRLPALAGFLGMVFVGNLLVNPARQSSKRSANPEEQ
jgi:hypothetical protein